MNATQADLWSTHAHDWAEVMEGWNGWGLPLYRHVLERVPIGAGSDVLDVGCGAGRFCRIAADRGAHLAGLDATPAFVEIARARVPAGDFRVGDMQALPWKDESFDLVTGFNSFFIADDMTAALSEAARVARTSASVAMTVFGRPENCASTQVFRAVGALLPPRPAQAGGDESPLHADGVLEAIVRRAGLEPYDTQYLQFEESYPDLATLLRGVMAAPPQVRAAQTAGDDAVREVIGDAVAEFAQPDGSYRLPEEGLCLIARA